MLDVRRLWQVRCFDDTQMSTAALMLAALLTPACGLSTPEPVTRPSQVGHEHCLAQLAAADALALREFNSLAKWTNPFLFVHPDGIELVPNERTGPGRHLSVVEIESTLCRLPRSAWPLGRTVAVQENGLGSGPAQEAHLAALLTMLESHAVLVNRWPSA